MPIPAEMTVTYRIQGSGRKRKFVKESEVIHRYMTPEEEDRFRALVVELWLGPAFMRWAEKNRAKLETESALDEVPASGAE